MPASRHIPMPEILRTSENRFETDLRTLDQKIQAVQLRLVICLQAGYNIILRPKARQTEGFRRLRAVRAALLKLMLAPFLAVLAPYLEEGEYQCLELLYHAIAADLAEGWYVRGAKRLQLAKEVKSSEARG